MELLLGYLAGLLTLINPCVLPVLPIILATALQAGRAGPLALAAGMSVSFVTFGMLVSTVGYAIGLDETVLSQAGAVAMLVFGAVLLVPQLSSRFELALSGVSNRADTALGTGGSTGFGGQFLGGLLLGAVWSPCIGPTLGGAIALAALTEKLVSVKAAAFCAPMWGLRTRVLGIRYLVWAMRAMGRSGDYAQQPGPPERFESNLVTNDRARWQMHRDLVDAMPDLDLGPVTWGWLGASLDILSTFAKASKLSSLNIPILVASADDEKLVDNRSHTRVASHLPDCEHIMVEEAMHEILMERDEKRAEFWTAFDRLLERAGV